MMIASKLLRTSPRPQEYFKGPPHHFMAGVPYNPNVFLGNGTGVPSQPVIIVRAEEALIVILVLALWIAAIALFFNRWGKIRMLEPYQPKFIQQHRPSCPLVDQVQHRSFSKYNINNDVFLNHQKTLRPRQNSVFVSSMMNLPMNAPRKVKSAFDLQNLVLSDPALNKSAVRFCPGGDYFRRSSLFPVNPRKAVAGDGEQGDGVHVPGERRLSFKDLVDMERAQLQRSERVQCHVEKEPSEAELSKRNRKIGETKQRSTVSAQSSLSDSRHNSITNHDLKSSVSAGGKLSGHERRSSQLFVQKEFSPHSDGNELRSEVKSGVNNFRRNSMLLINSLENDRNFLNPRENVKSGVVDFRRNSMLIINNLTEDMGYRSIGRNHSLGGSNIVLSGDFPPRRNSVIPPYCNDTGKKLSVPHVSVQKLKSPSVKPCALHATDSKHLSAHKSSKSLDCADAGKTSCWRTKDASQPFLLAEGKQQYLMPTVPQNFTGSSTSLNDCNAAGKKLGEESRSTGHLNADLARPKIVETRCCSSGDGKASATRRTGSSQDFHQLPTEEAKGDVRRSEDIDKVTVDVTTSLTQLNTASSDPLNMVTSSEALKSGSRAMQSSRV